MVDGKSIVAKPLQARRLQAHATDAGDGTEREEEAGGVGGGIQREVLRGGGGLHVSVQAGGLQAFAAYGADGHMCG